MDDKKDIIIVEDKEQAVDYLVRLWIEYASAAIRDYGAFRAALSGGRTPIDFYRQLAGVEEKEIWKNTKIFLTDERFVAFAHKDSNSRMIRENLIDRSPINLENYYPMLTDKGGTEKSAEYYDGLLRHEFGPGVKGQVPAFDFILLGIGENDGHIASLFSDEDLSVPSDKIVIATRPTHVKHERISLSLPVLNNAKRVVIFGVGENKADVLYRVFNKQENLPAAWLAGTDERLTYLVDQNAAKRLSLLD